MSLWRQRQIERRIGDLGEFARADERERKGKPKP
jgi:hypothetical protein